MACHTADIFSMDCSRVTCRFSISVSRTTSQNSLPSASMALRMSRMESKFIP